MTDLLSKFSQAVGRHADKVAIVNGTGDSVTFGQLHKRAQALAATRTRDGDRGGASCDQDNGRDSVLRCGELPIAQAFGA